MLIDIGADNKEDALRWVYVQDNRLFQFVRLQPMANPKKIMAKAWDNRYGCGLSYRTFKRIKR